MPEVSSWKIDVVPARSREEFFFLMMLLLDSSALEKEKNQSAEDAANLERLLAAETTLNKRLEVAVSGFCDELEVSAESEVEGDVRGDSLLRRFSSAVGEVSERVRSALHIGVKRALAVVKSAYEYDFDVVSDGFVFDPDATDAVNTERARDLIAAADEPGSKLAKLFECEVLPLAGGDDEEE